MEALHELRWHKLSLRLRNRRNEFAREHPLFIFKGIFKFACSASEPPLLCDYLYHPAGEPLPARIGRGQVYHLEIVFPLADAATVQRFSEGLARQLEKQPRNFDIEQLGPVECRSLAEAGRSVLPTLDLSASELCLDFLTPFVFNPVDPRRPWLLDAAGFIQLCTVHLARLYPQLPWPLEIEASDARLLPYFWDSGTIWHQSKSQPRRADGQRTRQKLEGFTGPLYLRGDWQRLLPLLLVCSELHTGYGKGDHHGLAAQRHDRHLLSTSQGAFRLRTGRTFFDRLIKDPARFLATARELSDDSDAAKELACSLDGGEAVARQVAKAIGEGAYQPGPARQFPIDKKHGIGERSIALLSAPDIVAHRTLHNILAPVCNRMFEHASVGFRTGCSIDTARQMMNQAINQGATHAVRADIESFFDMMDWEVLGAALRRALPQADRLTLAAIEQIIRAPLHLGGAPVLRERGILQGSPLSPLLANLCLDTFDEQMAALGHRLIRYGDDFAVLAPSREKADQALLDVNALLAPLKLALNPDKTVIAPLDLGFTFLGLHVPSALSEETVARSALKKTLFIKRPYAFTGLDGDSLVVRKDDQLLARLPLGRLGEIIFLGDGAVSTRLLQRCASLRIPVSFCSPAGWYSSTLKPDSQSWFALVAAHSRAHDALDDAGRLGAARRIVEAKLRNYAFWLRSQAGLDAKAAARTLIELCKELKNAGTIEALRGYEGSAARLAFALVNRFVKHPGFVSEKRLPREKPDRFNALLDMLYSLLFTRLNVLLRSQGLNPYLGFLHSHLDHYESLVCDLQEPFRCRMDRLALKLLNRQELTEASFEQKEGGEWRLTSDGVGVVVEAFEREEEVRLAGEPATLAQLLSGQVLAIRQWAEGIAAAPSFFTAEILGRSQRKSQNAREPS